MAEIAWSLFLSEEERANLFNAAKEVVEGWGDKTTLTIGLGPASEAYLYHGSTCVGHVTLYPEAGQASVSLTDEDGQGSLDLATAIRAALGDLEKEK